MDGHFLIDNHVFAFHKIFEKNTLHVFYEALCDLSKFHGLCTNIFSCYFYSTWEVLVM